MQLFLHKFSKFFLFLVYLPYFMQNLFIYTEFYVYFEPPRVNFAPKRRGRAQKNVFDDIGLLIYDYFNYLKIFIIINRNGYGRQTSYNFRYHPA